MTRGAAQLRSWRPPFNAQGLLRVLADMVMVNLSLMVAIGARFFAKLYLEDVTDPGATFRIFWGFYIDNALLLTLVSFIVFHLHGFYSRTRSYARRYKALVIIRAVTIAYISFTFTMYFLFRAELLPRGVTFLAWALSGVMLSGARLFKDYFSARVKIELMARGERAGQQRVLVIGGAGYIGSVLIRDLLERNYQVTVLDDLLYGDASIRELYDRAGFRFVKGDFRHIEAVVKAVQGCRAVIHLGAIVGDPAGEVDPGLTLDVNLAATRMIRQVAQGHGVERLLFASTCSVYGTSGLVLDENSAVRPLSLYARSKIDAEGAILSGPGEGLGSTVLRIATVFGMSYRPRFDLVVNLLTARAAKAGKFTIVKPEQWRPFIHVKDAARAFVTFIEAPPEDVRGEIFNVGADELNFTIGQVAEKVLAQFPKTFMEVGEGSGEERSYRVSFAKVRERLGFCCQVSLEEGIREVEEALREGRVVDYESERYSNSMLIRARADAGLNGMVDPATGLLNAASLRRLLESDDPGCIRYGDPFSTVLLAGVGSCRPEELAASIRKVLRSDDSAFHWAPGRFAILVPNSGPERARALADRLASQLRGSGWNLQTETVSAPDGSPSSRRQLAEKIFGL